MATPVDTEKFARTEDELTRLKCQRAEILVDAGDLKAKIVDLETERSKKTSEASRLQYEISRAELIDDPKICEPHGMESIVEPPGVMSAGAMIHIEDGETCYAASIGRRSDFTPEELEIYRRIKRRSR
jgi:hypothetical protein